MPSLDTIEAAQGRVVALERELVAARAERDRLIIHALNGGASQYEIAKRINITKQAVQVIAKKAAL
jgi:DNA-binding NarL/FixJ family response regulator